MEGLTIFIVYYILAGVFGLGLWWKRNEKVIIGEIVICLLFSGVLIPIIFFKHLCMIKIKKSNKLQSKKNKNGEKI